jgi:hypothetical protein
MNDNILTKSQMKSLGAMLSFANGARVALCVTFPDDGYSYDVDPSYSFAKHYTESLCALINEVLTGEREIGQVSDMLDVPLLMGPVGGIADQLFYQWKMEWNGPAKVDEQERESDWEKELADQRRAVLEAEVAAAEEPAVEEWTPEVTEAVETISTGLFHKIDVATAKGVGPDEFEVADAEYAALLNALSYLSGQIKESDGVAKAGYIKVHDTVERLVVEHPMSY